MQNKKMNDKNQTSAADAERRVFPGMSDFLLRIYSLRVCCC